MKQIRTKDDSVTFFNSEYDETYHSTSGAIEESFEKFVKPSKVKEFVKNNKEIKLLDICFGVGYNSAALIDEVLKNNKDCRIFITALENDKEIIEQIPNITPEFKNYSIIKELAKSKNKKFSSDNINMKLIIEDALKSIKKINNKFDFVFLDPFSPKKCPELWTEEFFKDIFNLMKPNSILTTYSCARSVRDNLTKAGFKVEDGPCIGRRSPSTIAYKSF